MSTLTPQSYLDTLEGIHSLDEIENHVQRLFADLEAAPQAVQDIFLSRLLGALATKVPSKMAGKIFTTAKEELSATGKGNTPSRSTGSRAKKTDDPPVTLDPFLPQLADPTDPVEAWEHFGPVQLREILPYEPEGYIDRMLVHPRLPKGKAPAKTATRTKKVENILQRLEKEFGTH